MDVGRGSPHSKCLLCRECRLLGLQLSTNSALERRGKSLLTPGCCMARLQRWMGEAKWAASFLQSAPIWTWCSSNPHFWQKRWWNKMKMDEPMNLSLPPKYLLGGDILRRSFPLTGGQWCSWRAVPLQGAGSKSSSIGDLCRGGCVQSHRIGRCPRS